MSDSTRRCESQFRWPQPGELWSLWELYNFVLSEFYDVLTVVAHAHERTRDLDRLGTRELLEDDRRAYLVQFEKAQEFCLRHDFLLAQHACEIILKWLNQPPMSMARLRDNTASLHEALKADAKKIKAYIYRNERADILASVDKSWSDVFERMPDTEPEIRAALDLWALDHGTASVFHSMRACELGLRFVAKKFKVKFSDKPMEWAMWSSLLNKLENELVALRKEPNGPKKDRDKEFLGAVISHWRSIQEKRDAVMHVRKEFDTHEALSVFLHVQQLLRAIADRYPPRKPKT